MLRTIRRVYRPNDPRVNAWRALSALSARTGSSRGSRDVLPIGRRSAWPALERCWDRPSAGDTEGAIARAGKRRLQCDEAILAVDRIAQVLSGTAGEDGQVFDLIRRASSGPTRLRQWCGSGDWVGDPDGLEHAGPTYALAMGRTGWHDLPRLVSAPPPIGRTCYSARRASTPMKP